MDGEYEWDEAKRLSNFRRHALDFEDVILFDWTSALVEPDTRKDYRERRYIATGKFLGRLTVLVFTIRGQQVRIISWRKANVREQRAYGTQDQE